VIRRKNATSEVHAPNRRSVRNEPYALSKRIREWAKPRLRLLSSGNSGTAYTPFTVLGVASNEGGGSQWGIRSRGLLAESNDLMVRSRCLPYLRHEGS
jgi:hypothetical protein